MEKIIFLISKEDKELLIQRAKSYRISLSWVEGTKTKLLPATTLGE